MKIAVISDIHGNLEALKAVMTDIKEHGITKIYCLGDLAFCGPEPKETIEYFRNELKDVVMIQGNTDEMIIKATEAEDNQFMPKHPVMASAIRYSQQVLDDEDKTYLANLQIDYKESFEALNVLFVHGSPRKNNEGITVNMKYSKLEEILEGVEEHMVFCGHTHYPIIHRCANKTVVNVGSVGRPFGENLRAVYVILDLTRIQEREYDIEHRYVKYDTAGAADRLEQCDFEGAETLSYMLRVATDKFPQPADLN